MAVKRSDISDATALRACWPWGTPDGTSALSNLEALGFPTKVAIAKLEHLEARGLAQSGVSIAYVWRTPEGEALLTAEAASWH
jgi:hypothetical protein